MKRLISSALLAVVLTCALVPSVALADDQGYLGRVTADDTLNLRAEPNTESKVLEKIEGGTTLVILDSVGSFFKVSYGGDIGYLSDEFTVKLDHWVGVCTADDVNLRKGAGTSYKVIDTLDKGDKVFVYSEVGDYFLVVRGTTKCYIAKEYIKKEATSSKSTSTKSSESSQESSRESDSTKYHVEVEREFSEEELYMAAQLIYSEGNYQSEESFQAMATVVYNRVVSPKFPDSIAEVTFQENQFSYPDRDPAKFLKLKPSKKAQEAVYKVFVEGKLTLPPEIMYFKSAKLSKDWGSSREYYTTIGGNMYYS